MKNFQLALITGATSGIGEELAKLLAEKGISLMLAGRDREKLNTLKEKLKVSVEVVQADLLDPKARQELIKKIHQKAPDLVINNAGFGAYGPALTYSTEEQMHILEINGNVVLELSMEAARTLISKNKKGVILNVSSAASFLPFSNFTVYAASKAFSRFFSEAFDAEVKTSGVRVLTACPGMVETKFRDRAGGEELEGMEKKQVMTPEFAAKEIWRQIEKEQIVHTFDWRYKLAILAAKLIPAEILTKILRKNIEKRSPNRKFLPIDE